MPALLQIDASIPAPTVGAGLIVRCIALEAATHGEVDCAVRVKVTVPVSPVAGV